MAQPPPVLPSSSALVPECARLSLCHPLHELIEELSSTWRFCPCRYSDTVIKAALSPP